MNRQLIAGRIAVCVFGGMLALVALSMTPALALNPQPLPPKHEEIFIEKGHKPSVSHPKGFNYKPGHLQAPRISH